MVIGLGGVGPEIDGELGLDAQQVAPLHGPVVGELGAFEQAIDEGGALVRGRGRARNCDGFLRGGQGADDVEVDAAEEDGVGGEVGGLDVEALQAGEDAGVDGGLRGQRGGALVGRIEGSLGARGGDSGGDDGQRDLR